MSASRERKKRLEKRAQEALNPSKKKKKPSSAAVGRIFGRILIVLVVLGALFLFISGTGLLQANLTALTVDGIAIKGSEFNFHYFTQVNDYISTYENVYVYYGMALPFDKETSLKTQEYSETQSWADYFEEQTINTLTRVIIQSEKAKADGMTITASDKANIDLAIENLQQAVEQGNSNTNSELRKRFGRGINEEKYRAYLERYYLSARYSDTIIKGFDRSADKLEEYYEENSETYDNVQYNSFSFEKEPPIETDEDGNDIELTDEEVDDFLAQQEAKANEMLERVTTADTFEALSKEYDESEEEEAETEDEEAEDEDEEAEDEDEDEEAEDEDDEEEDVEDETALDEAVADLSEPFDEYLGDTARKPGDKTVLEDDDYFYVVLFNSRTRDETRDVDVRHILVKFPEDEEDEDADSEDEGDDEVSEQVKADTKAKAEAILAEWESGEKTTESFSILAIEKSEDDASAVNGGLIANINPDSTYVEPFLNWSVDPNRKFGDTGIVETIYGYHVMYMEKPYTAWERSVRADMDTEEYDEHYTTISEGKEPEPGKIGLFFTKSLPRS